MDCASTSAGLSPTSHFAGLKSGPESRDWSVELEGKQACRTVFEKGKASAIWILGPPRRCRCNSGGTRLVVAPPRQWKWRFPQSPWLCAWAPFEVGSTTLTYCYADTHLLCSSHVGQRTRHTHTYLSCCGLIGRVGNATHRHSILGGVPVTA